MGKIKGKGGITRLMAICITRGPDSPQRARALIRDHNVDVKEKDHESRLALHHALGARERYLYHRVYKWYETPLNYDLVRVLIETYPLGRKVRDVRGRIPLHQACDKYVPAEVIKLVLGVYSAGLEDAPCSSFSPLTLTALAREKAVKENACAAKRVADALMVIAKSNTGRKECFSAGALAVLITLSREKAVKEYVEAALSVAKAYNQITNLL